MASGTLFVVMGVSGVGKSTLAEALAKRCAGEYLDADTFHPPGNVLKMKSGTPLDDHDRNLWLSRLNTELRRRAAQATPVFLACSALKESYRRRLADGGIRLAFIHLTAPREAILQRMQQRASHYMPASLLDSQIAILEEPAGALTLDARWPLSDLVEQVKGAFPELSWS